MAENEFLPRLITTWPIRDQAEFDSLNLGDTYDNDAPVVHKFRSQGENYINFCRSRSVKNCKICLYKANITKCEYPVTE